MKTIKNGKKISLKKEKIVFLSHTQLNQVRGGGPRTWINCNVQPVDPKEASINCGVV
jgi:hypothetical protein